MSEATRSRVNDSVQPIRMQVLFDLIRGIKVKSRRKIISEVRMKLHAPWLSQGTYYGSANEDDISLLYSDILTHSYM